VLGRPAYLEQSALHLGEDVAEDVLVGQLGEETLQSRGAQRQPGAVVAAHTGARQLRRRVRQLSAQLVEQRLDAATHLRHRPQPIEN